MSELDKLQLEPKVAYGLFLYLPIAKNLYF